MADHMLYILEILWSLLLLLLMFFADPPLLEYLIFLLHDNPQVLSSFNPAKSLLLWTVLHYQSPFQLERQHSSALAEYLNIIFRRVHRKTKASVENLGEGSQSLCLLGPSEIRSVSATQLAQILCLIGQVLSVLKQLNHWTFRKMNQIWQHFIHSQTADDQTIQ